MNYPFFDGSGECSVQEIKFFEVDLTRLACVFLRNLIGGSEFDF